MEIRALILHLECKRGRGWLICYFTLEMHKWLLNAHPARGGYHPHRRRISISDCSESCGHFICFPLGSFQRSDCSLRNPFSSISLGTHFPAVDFYEATSQKACLGALLYEPHSGRKLSPPSSGQADLFQVSPPVRRKSSKDGMNLVVPACLEQIPGFKREWRGEEGVPRRSIGRYIWPLTRSACRSVCWPLRRRGRKTFKIFVKRERH